MQTSNTPPLLHREVQLVRSRLIWAIVLVIAALLLVQDSPADLYRSGLAAFESGRVDASAHAFDQLIELRPESKPDLWQRGIALY